MAYNYIDNKKFTDEIHDFNKKNNPLKFYNEIYDFYVKEMDCIPEMNDDWWKIFDIYFDYRMKVITKAFDRREANMFAGYDKLNLSKFKDAAIQELNEYKKVMREYDPKNGLKKTLTPSNYIGQCLLDISNKLASSGKFYLYTWKEEMIGDGIEQSLRYMHNFSKVKTNNGAFSYFSQLIGYAFIRRITTEKKQAYVKFHSQDYYRTISMSDCMEDITSDFALDYMDKLDDSDYL